MEEVPRPEQLQRGLAAQRDLAGDQPRDDQPAEGLAARGQGEPGLERSLGQDDERGGDGAPGAVGLRAVDVPQQLGVGVEQRDPQSSNAYGVTGIPQGNEIYR